MLKAGNKNKTKRLKNKIAINFLPDFLGLVQATV